MCANHSTKYKIGTIFTFSDLKTDKLVYQYVIIDTTFTCNEITKKHKNMYRIKYVPTDSFQNSSEQWVNETELSLNKFSYLKVSVSGL